VESIFTRARHWRGDLGLDLQRGYRHGMHFLTGPRQLCDPGPDGILGTVDDNCAGLPDAIVLPGPDGRSAMPFACRYRISHARSHYEYQRELVQIQVMSLTQADDGQAAVHLDYNSRISRRKF